MRPTLLGLLVLTALVAVPASAFAGERVRPLEDAAQPDRASFRAQVLGVLERHPSVVAKNTLAAVRDGKVVFDTLDRLTVADCRQLVEENPAQWSGVVSADECIAGDDGVSQVPSRILQRVSGYQHENRIYVRADAKAKDAAATLVHETNHVANATHERYSSSREKLEEEYRAYWVALVFTDGRAPGAGYLGWLKGWIIEQYALAGVAPADLTDRPAGNLDNSFPSTSVASR
jgi:hypothetical protein